MKKQTLIIGSTIFMGGLWWVAIYGMKPYQQKVHEELLKQGQGPNRYIPGGVTKEQNEQLFARIKEITGRDPRVKAPKED